MKYIISVGKETLFERSVFLKRTKNDLLLVRKTTNNDDCTIAISEWSTNNCAAIHICISQQSGVMATFETDTKTVVLCYAGSHLTVAQKDNTSYTLQNRSNILVYGKDMEVLFQPDIKQPGEAFFLVFSPDLIEIIKTLNPVVVKILTAESGIYPCMVPNRNVYNTTLEAETTISMIKDLKRTGELSSFIMETKGRELLLVYLLQQERNKCLSCSCFQHSRHQIFKAQKILEAQFQNPPTIKQLAQEVGICETILKTGFKSIFGTTVYGYLFDYRMRIAREVLMEKSHTISEVAERLGYEYQSHFTSAFKRKFGVSPGEFRKHMA